MKVICSMVNETYGCDKCPHGKIHEPIDARFTYKDGEKVPSGKCTSKGMCYAGRHERWDCKCTEVKED